MEKPQISPEELQYILDCLVDIKTEGVEAFSLRLDDKIDESIRILMGYTEFESISL